MQTRESPELEIQQHDPPRSTPSNTHSRPPLPSTYLSIYVLCSLLYMMLSFVSILQSMEESLTSIGRCSRRTYLKDGD